MGADNFAPEGGEGKGRRGANYEGGDGFLTRPAGQGGPADVRARYENWSTSVRAVASIDADTDIQARARVYRDDRTLRFAGADSASTANDASIRLVHRGRWQLDALAYLQTRNFANKVISSSSHNRKSVGKGKSVSGRVELG